MPEESFHFYLNSFFLYLLCFCVFINVFDESGLGMGVEVGARGVWQLYMQQPARLLIL